MFSQPFTDRTVREDLLDAHRRTWKRLAAPGSWWSGPERLAIANAGRQAPECTFCAERERALSPYSVTGEHLSDGALPAPTVDTVHRVITDPTRLTRSWLESLSDDGITDGHYVELLGCALAVLDVDEGRRALGLEPEPLPDPQPGEPSGYRPAGLRESVHWVPVLDPANPPAAEADLFPGQRTGNVLLALSLVPDAMRMVVDLHSTEYVPTERVPDLDDNAGRALTRHQIELLASRVSELNDCFY